MFTQRYTNIHSNIIHYSPKLEISTILSIYQVVNGYTKREIVFLTMEYYLTIKRNILQIPATIWNPKHDELQKHYAK